MQEGRLSRIANAFDLHDARLNLISGGQTSYVYEFEDDKRPLILRVVKNGGDRYKLTCAETDFVKYLTDNGINASRPVTSRSGALAELLEVTEGKFIVTAQGFLEDRIYEDVDILAKFKFEVKAGI